MAIPTSGTITMTDIVTEFGGTAPHAISEYYRGGGLVPDSSTNINVPTSGTISFTDFYGAQNSIWAFNLIVGYYNVTPPGFDFIGYDSVLNIGTVTDDTCDFKGGATMTIMRWDNAGTGTVRFELTGNQTNADFTTLEIDSSVTTLTLNRTAATYAYVTSSNKTSWSWNNITNSPWGSTGSTVPVTFQ